MAGVTFEQTWRCQGLNAIGGESCGTTVTFSGQSEFLPAGWHLMTLKRRSTDGEMEYWDRLTRKVKNIALCPDCSNEHIDRLDDEIVSQIRPFS